MKAYFYACLVVVCCALMIHTAQADKAEASEIAVTAQGNHFQLGPNFYPTSRYPADSNTYLIGDKDNFASDVSMVFRDRGNARAEIGIVSDNDLHIKMVTGTYGSEIFTDRLLIRAEGGQVDSFGTLLRQYATSGRPTIVVGNSDLLTGAGLELAYDHEARQGSISSVEHGNGYTSLLVKSNGVQFLQGGDAVVQVASISNNGLVTAPAVISGGTTFTVSGCSAHAAVGGAAAGRFRVGMAGTCVATVTINGKTGTPAPNGWACSASNLTRPSYSVRQISSTTTTATFRGKTTKGDVISFYCMGY